jgi:hypothetical protein
VYQIEFLFVKFCVCRRSGDFKLGAQSHPQRGRPLSYVESSGSSSPGKTDTQNNTSPPPPQETTKGHGWQPKEAASRQRHRIRQRLATGAWRDFHENKIARLPYVDHSTEYARTLRHLQASDARGRAEKNRAQTAARPWDAGSAGRLSRGAHALWLRESSGDAPT